MMVMRMILFEDLHVKQYQYIMCLVCNCRLEVVLLNKTNKTASDILNRGTPEEADELIPIQLCK
jgi:hypothetical protein